MKKLLIGVMESPFKRDPNKKVIHIEVIGKMDVVIHTIHALRINIYIYTHCPI